MILHVCSFDKFIPPFINLVNEEFGTENHQFWLVGVEDLQQHPIEKANNIFIVNQTIGGNLHGYFRLFLMLNRSEKVIIHGLLNRYVNALLALCPWLLKKCYWVIWGKDLYQYEMPKPCIKDKIRECVRKFVIKRIGHLVTYIPGDLDLARRWYDARGEYHECLMYPSNVINPNILQSVGRTDGERSGVNILVGNSANPTNNHIETFEKLRPYQEYNLNIYVPLSYGNQANAKKVIEKGRCLFGEKLIPLTAFMPFEEYLAFLGRIDIAIFNHGRQQAMGNTITLLGLGKTIYMRSDVSQWDFLKKLGLNIKSVSDAKLEQFSSDKLISNSKIVRSYFTKERLISQYSQIFRS